MAKYVDLHTETEDMSIEEIGRAAMRGLKVAVVLDDEPGKLERYLRKLRDRYPKVRVIEQFKSPTPGVVSVIILHGPGECRNCLASNHTGVWNEQTNRYDVCSYCNDTGKIE